MNGRKAESSFTKESDKTITLEKNIETERMSYMTYEMKLREFTQAGYHQGMQNGRLESINTLIKNTHWSAEKAMNSISREKSMQKEYLAMLQTK